MRHNTKHYLQGLRITETKRLDEIEGLISVLAAALLWLRAERHRIINRAITRLEKKNGPQTSL